MLKDIDVARYFISKDPLRKHYNKDLMEKNGRMFYIGNARLNKLLHLAQILYIAKTGKPIMDATFYAYDNGAVSTNVQENYTVLLHYPLNTVDTMTVDEKEFLDRFYKAFETADVDELIQLSHEDPEWLDNHNFFEKEQQSMDLTKHAAEYRERFKDMLTILYRMD